VLVRPSLSFDVYEETSAIASLFSLRYAYLLYLLLPYYSHPRHTPIRSRTSNRPIGQARKSLRPNPPARLIARQLTTTGHLSYCFLISTHAIFQRHIFSTLSLNPSKYPPLRLPSIACLLFVSIITRKARYFATGGKSRLFPCSCAVEVCAWLIGGEVGYYLGSRPRWRGIEFVFREGVDLRYCFHLNFSWRGADHPL
jgi:hypothetical protein